MTDPVFPQELVYVRHRKRMVAMSVFNDLARVLRDAGWLRPDWTPQTPGTTAAAMESTLLETKPLAIIDYFPDQAPGQQVVANTLAMNAGDPQPPEENQLGGGKYAYRQVYRFHFAFWAASDAAADALFQDMADRYNGLTDSPFISLFNYATSPPTPVVRMEVEAFAWTMSQEQLAGNGQRLYFGQLILTDYVDEADRAATS